MPDIMTVHNPTCDRVSCEFAEYLDDIAKDFTIRYCGVIVTLAVRDELHSIIDDPTTPDGDRKVARLLLDKAEEQGWGEEDDWSPGVEIMIG